MANCNWRNNFIGNIKIGDSTFERDEEMEIGVVNFYEGLFMVTGVSHQLVDDLNFDS